MGDERTTLVFRPIETAPEAERVIVAGFQPKFRATRGYWWWHEDTVWDGKAVDHPNATHWCPISLPPFPEPPE